MSQVANSLVDVTVRYRPHIHTGPPNYYCDLEAEGLYRITPPATIVPGNVHVEVTAKNLTPEDRGVTVYVDSPCFSGLLHGSIRFDAGAIDVTDFNGVPAHITSGAGPMDISVRVVDRHTSPTPDETLLDWTVVDEIELLTQACIEGETVCIGDDEYTCVSGVLVLTRLGGCVSPVCTVEGSKMCIGPDEHTCTGGVWVLTGPGLCGVCVDGEKKCDIEGEYTCINGQWVLTDPDACKGLIDMTKYYWMAGGVALLGGLVLLKPWKK